MSVDWSVDIKVMKPLPFFDRPLRIEVEIQTSPAYCHEGRCDQDKERMIVLYTLSGEGEYEDKNGVQVLGRGSVMLCNPGDPAICYRYPVGHNAPWRFLWFGFTGRSALEKGEELRKQFGSIYHIPYHAEIIQRLLSLKSHYGFVFGMTPFEGAALILDLLTALYESHTENRPSEPTHQLIERALQLINAQKVEAISVSQIADSLNVSREHLSRIFKRYTGTSLQQYTLQKKIQEACRLLKDTGYSIKEVSYTLGFKDQRNFTRTFKMQVGMAPRRFRQTCVTAMYMRE